MILPVLFPIFRTALLHDHYILRMLSSKKEESVFYCSHFQRIKCTHANSHYGKIKGVDRFVQHICATCWREDNKKSFHPECSENCPFQGN